MTYVDLCFINEGPSFCEAAEYELLLDGELVASGSCDTLSDREMVQAHNIPIVVSEGLHTLSATIYALDPSGRGVYERNLEDNTFSHEWYWAPPEIQVSGGPILMRDANILDPASPGYMKPVAGFPVELWEHDDVTPDNRLDITTTLFDGTYSFPSIENSDWPDDRRDIYVRVLPVKEAVWVTGATEDDTLCLYTDTVQEVPSGTHDYGATNLDFEGSTPFFVADAVQENYDIWTNLRPLDVPVGLRAALAFWDPDNCRSCYTVYTDGYSVLHINNADLAQKALPDCWDRFIIGHEYCHHLEYTFGFFKDFPVDFHAWEYINVPANFTASESFANFWAGYVAAEASTRLYDKWLFTPDSLAFYEFFDLENGWMGDNFRCMVTTGQLCDTLMLFRNHYGLMCEGSVSGLLWDIYDSQDDDQSTPGIGYPQPDNIGDTLSLGIEPILEALLDRYITYGTLPPRHPQTMQEFMYAWHMKGSSLGHTQALKDIFYEHGYTDCCFGMKGNANNSADEEPTIADVSNMIDELFISQSPVIVCREEADIDGNDTVQIPDILALIDYLFINVTPLGSCE